MLEQLDFLYTPSRDVAGDVAWFVEALGGRLVFAIDDGGTRVAMVELTSTSPRILLTDHLDGERPVLIYRVNDLDAAARDAEARGFKTDRMLEIPPGPCRTFLAPGGHRIALYQATRPQVIQHFEGRFDF